MTIIFWVLKDVENYYNWEMFDDLRFFYKEPQVF